MGNVGFINHNYQYIVFSESERFFFLFWVSLEIFKNILKAPKFIEIVRVEGEKRKTRIKQKEI